jgi:transcription elongation GreA/GreB family factor
MNKSKVIEALIASLEEQHAAAKNASEEAADYATHEEAKADSKYDTQGLEASYLAAGQASLVQELSEAIQLVKTYRETAQNTSGLIAVGSLCSVKMGSNTQWFFLSGAGGGIQMNLEGKSIMVLTPASPLGSRLTGANAGDSFVMPNGVAAAITHAE